jgi:hypothetical protein
MSLLQDGEKIPKAESSYFKLQDGDNRVHILAKPTVGYSAKVGGKFVHKKSDDDFNGLDVEQPKFGTPVKYFWAMPVWNCEDKRVQILEITQKQIMYGLEQLDENPKWGGITRHNTNIMRGESNGRVQYATVAEPNDLTDDDKSKIKAVKVDMSRLFNGENPIEVVEQKEQKKEVRSFDDDLSLDVPF